MGGPSRSSHFFAFDSDRLSGVFFGVIFRFALLFSLLSLTSLAVRAQTALQMPPKSAERPPLLPPVPHPTLDRIHAASSLTCGVAREEEDYSRATDHGNRAAFDVDLCKAVAVAVLGPGAHLVIKNFPDEPTTLRALRSGEVDLVATATPTAKNMAADVAFSAPVLLDGQSLLFPNNPSVHTAADLAGKRVCFLTGAAAEDGLHSYATAHGISYVWYPFSEAGEMEAAFFTRNCDAVTSDVTSLANIRGIEERRSAEFTILPQTLREDPLAMATWAGDPRFSAIVYWTVQTLLGAEVLGITRANLATFNNSPAPEVQQVLGRTSGTGAALGIDTHWGAAVIATVGNYGEIFERDLGAASKLKLERGDNRPSSQGGALHPVPLQDR